jgi:hypothetical protein
MTPGGAAASLAETLLAAQNRDGGWGASAGGNSSSEATAASMMAIAATGRDAQRARVDDAVAWLTRTQKTDGGWAPMPAVRESSWSTAPAVIALANLVPASDAAARGWRWLVEHEGAGLGWLGRIAWKLFSRVRVTDLDPELKGWPWIPGAFSWVEPTALGLIALKKLKPAGAETKVVERVRQGELMIYDRMCQGGGWNYGNSKTLGEMLQPYPDTTALALLALADHRDRDANRQGLDVLRRSAPEVGTGLALALSVLCFDVYGQDTAALRTQLASAYEATRFFGKTRSAAFALLALAGGAGMLRPSHAHTA